MLQSFSGPKYPNGCGFCFTRRCWSCTSPGAPGLSLAGPHAGAAAARSCPRGGGCASAAFGAGRGTAGAEKVEVVHGRIPWCCHMRFTTVTTERLGGEHLVPLERAVCFGSPEDETRPSSCAAKTLKIPVTSALTNSNNLLLLSSKLAKYFTPL